MSGSRPDVGIVGRGAMWSMTNNIAGQALSLIVFLVTARYVSKEAFGIMAVSLITVEAFKQIVINSFGTSLAANRAASKEDYNACFLSILVSGIASGAALFFLAEPVAKLLGHAEIADTIKLVCIILFVAGLSHTHEVWLSKHIQFKMLALRSIISIVFGGAVGICMAINGYGLNALVAQQIVTAVTALIFLWSATSWRPGIETGKDNVVSLLHYSKFIFLSRATSFFGAQSDVYFSSYHFGATVTGVYNAAKRIMLAFSATLSSGLNSVALPVFAAYGHDDEGLARGFLKAAGLTSLLTAPLCFGLVAISDDAIQILLGEKWMDAAPVLSALILSAYVTSIIQYNHNVCLVRGKPQWEMWLNTAYTIANIALFVWLVRYGAVMLAAAVSIRAVVMMPFSLLPALYLLKLPVSAYLKEILPSVLAAVGMSVAVYCLKIYALADLSAFIRLVVLVPAGGAVYAALVFVLNRKLFQEVAQIFLHMRRK